MLLLIFLASSAWALDPCGQPTSEECNFVGEIFPNNCDCYSYFLCLPNETVDTFYCPEGLVFEPNMGACISADQVPSGVCNDQDDCGRPNPEVCGDSSSFFPNTCDCSLYYACLPNGSLGEFECEDELVFDPATAVCTFPNNVDGPCSAQNDCGKDQCAFEGDFIPNTCDCTKYFRCLADGVIELECPEGFLFDPNAKVCVFPGPADCQ
jgi:hypothetical protein